MDFYFFLYCRTGGTLLPRLGADSAGTPFLPTPQEPHRFGLSHFNKRAAYFNWRYVLLAAIAGLFYGRAWLRERRIGASAVTHATVDSVWSLFLR